MHGPMIHSWTKHWTKHYWSLPVNALCEAHIGNAGSIVSQQVNMWVQDTCVHWLAVLWQHWNTGVLMRHTLYTTNKTHTHSTDNCVHHWQVLLYLFLWQWEVSPNWTWAKESTDRCQEQMKDVMEESHVEKQKASGHHSTPNQKGSQCEVQTTDVWHDLFQIFWKQILQHLSGIFEDKYIGSSDGKPARTNFN